MQTIRQIIIKDRKNQLITVSRYDVEKQLLYKQNRSYDLEICLDDFLDRLKTTKTQINKKKFKIFESRVNKFDLWPQK